MKALFSKEVEMLKKIDKDWRGMIRFFEARENAIYVDEHGSV